MNWQSLASNAGPHNYNGSFVPGDSLNTPHDEDLRSAIVQQAAFSGKGFISDSNTTGRPGHQEATVANRLGVAGAQPFGVTSHDAASSDSSLSQSQSKSLWSARPGSRPCSGGPTDMDDMDMEVEDETTDNHDNQNNHHSAPTELSIHTPTSAKLVKAASSPSQEKFVGGFGTTGLKSVLHPTPPRSPVGAWSNTYGDPGVAQLRPPGLLSDTPQAPADAAASATPATGKERSRKQCENCGSVIGRWGAVKKADRSRGGKSCGSCGGYVAVGRETKSESRLQEEWSKTSATFATPPAVERAFERGKNNSSGKVSSKGQIDERRRMPSGTIAIPFTANEDDGNHGGHGGRGGLVHGAKWTSQETQLASPAESERQARRTKHCKRVREEEDEDSTPAAPLSSADSGLARRGRGNDMIAPMPRLSWGQSDDHSPTHGSKRASSGTVVGGGGNRGEDSMAATSTETRPDPPSNRVSKRRKSDQSHGDTSPFKSSVMVAARSKYQIVQHRGFDDNGEIAGGSSDSTDKGALDEATVTGASGQSTHSPGVGSSSSITINRRHDSRTGDTYNSSSGSYRRRYRDEYKNKPWRRQGLAPSPLHTPRHKGSSEATGSCATPGAPTPTVDPAVPILVVIDGSNVAFSFRQDVSNPRWSPQGILLAVKFFQERGVPVVAFVPRPRADSIAPGSEHYDAFMEAVRSQAIATVPSKANDDLFILLYAIQRSAHIVSNDQFRDHLGNASTLDSLGLSKNELRTFLVDHHVSYTFARDEFVANPEAAIITMLTKQTAGVGSEIRRRGTS